jgi:putative ABC transport system substrate-binding protein
MTLQRRDFITLLGSAAALPVAATAQQGDHMRRVAVLHINSGSDPEAQSWMKAFMEGMAVFGWTEGRNVRIDIRWAGGDVNQLQTFAKELADPRPDVVLAVGTPSVNAILRETRVTPIVFSLVTDPVAQGLVESLARPGGYITGFAVFEPAIGGRWVQVLKEIAPEMKHAAVIFNPETAPYYKLYMKSIEEAGVSFAVRTFEASVRSRTEIESVMSNLAREPASGAIVMSDTFPTLHRDLIIALAARYRMPVAYPYRVFVADGGLISYGVDWTDEHRRAASYVDRILKGEKPAELPVQFPTKYELVINLKTARSLGHDVPLTLLTRADDLIE